VHGRLHDPKLIFFIEQNNKYLSSENPHTLIQLPLYDLKVGVLCAISANGIIGLMFCGGTLDAEQYINDIVNFSLI
jgi:hypothetical protein